MRLYNYQRTTTNNIMSTPFTNIKNAEDIKKRFESPNTLSAKHPGVNTGEIVRSESFDMPLDFVRKYYRKIAVDELELQRFLDPWDQNHINSYLTTVLNGMNKKDLFQLIDIESQIDWLKEKLDGRLTEIQTQEVKVCLKYFEYWRDKNYLYMCIDGQHRLKYLYMYLTSKITFEVLDGFTKEWLYNNEYHSINDTYFENLNLEIQEYINDIPLQTTMYTGALLSTYAKIFSSSNKGKPMHPHEDRMVLNKSDWVEYLISKILSSSHRNEFGKYVTFTKPSLVQKGDTHFVTKLFPWWCSQKSKSLITIPNNYNFKDSENDFLFESPTIPDGYIADFDKIWQMVVTSVINCKPSSKMNLASLTNFFYYVYKFTDGGIGEQKYSIELPDDFLTEFLKKEDLRKKRTEFARNPDGTIVVDSTGKQIENTESYTRKCKATTFPNFKLRIKEMDKDIFKDYQELHNTGIIKPKGSRKSSLSVFDVAEANDFKDGKGNDITAKNLYSSTGTPYEINEIEPVSAGGKRTLDNVNLLTSQDNKAEFNKIQKYNK